MQPSFFGRAVAALPFFVYTSGNIRQQTRQFCGRPASLKSRPALAPERDLRAINGLTFHIPCLKGTRCYQFRTAHQRAEDRLVDGHVAHGPELFLREQVPRQWLELHDQHITELKKSEKGARAVITLLADLEGDGVAGDRTLEGNEEAMKSYDQVIRIDQLRHANRHEGRMADQKSVVEFRNNSRDVLATGWLNVSTSWRS